MSEAGYDYEANLLRQYENWNVYLHESQTYLGRTYIALARDGEIDPFTDTTLDEQAELRDIVGAIKTALERLYQPDLLNYANLRNTWRHCHWHIIPRYSKSRVVLGHTFEDPNWGRNYAPYPATALSEEVYEKVKLDLASELTN